MDERLPVVPKELLEFLRRAFPTEVPGKALPYEDYLLMSGQKSVLRKIEDLYQKQQNKVIT